MIFGYILVIVGALFFLQNVGFLPPISWHYIWPLLLIGWGVTIILGKGRKGIWCCFPHQTEEKDKAS